MPKIAEKVKVLDGRGSVVRYASGTSSGKYFYQELVKGTKTYKTRLIEGASTMDEALSKVIDIAFEINKDIPTNTSDAKEYKPTPTSKRKPKKTLITDAIDAFVRKEELRASSNVITEKTVDNKRRLLNLHLKAYLSEEGIIYTDEIKLGVFHDYVPFRKREGTPNLFLSKEVAHIKDFVQNYLYPNELINPFLANDKKLFPKVEIRPDDLLKNPAIMPDDWNTIINYTREWVNKKRKQSDTRAVYWSYVLWHFLLLGKNTGMDREELLRLKWKNIETIDVGRTNSKGEQEEWLETYIYTTRSKTGVSREIPCNQGRELRRLLKLQKATIKRFGLTIKITDDTLVFGNVFKNMEPYSKGYFHQCFRYQIFQPLQKTGKLKGHKFSPHDYTIKSLRSTFIEDKLRGGTDIFLLSRVAGHDPKILMRHYEKMDIRTRSSELTIDTTRFGETKPSKGKKIDLLNEDKTYIGDVELNVVHRKSTSTTNKKMNV